MRVAPDLARLRRRLLRRYLAEAGLDAGEVALTIGVSVEYLQKMLAGSRVVSDAAAWRLSSHRAQTLRREVLAWRNGAAVFSPSCR
jgi:hypothetical protein